MLEEEEQLVGGNVADSVVRIGSTIRKAATVATPAVQALLDHLHSVGFTEPHNLSESMSVDGRSLSSYHERYGTESDKAPWPIYEESAF